MCVAVIAGVVAVVIVMVVVLCDGRDYIDVAVVVDDVGGGVVNIVAIVVAAVGVAAAMDVRYRCCHCCCVCCCCVLLWWWLFAWLVWLRLVRLSKLFVVAECAMVVVVVNGAIAVVVIGMVVVIVNAVVAAVVVVRVVVIVDESCYCGGCLSYSCSSPRVAVSPTTKPAIAHASCVRVLLPPENRITGCHCERNLRPEPSQ